MVLGYQCYIAALGYIVCKASHAGSSVKLSPAELCVSSGCWQILAEWKEEYTSAFAIGGFFNLLVGSEWKGSS